jgi:cardiolipin synthase
LKLAHGYGLKPNSRSVFRRHPRLSFVALGLLCLLGLGAWLLARSWRESDAAGFQLRVSPPSSRGGFTLALYQSLGVRLTGGHSLVLLPNGKVFDAIVQRIDSATSSVHIAMYIWEKGAASDRVVSALIARAKTGVRCRILVDDVGSPDFIKTVAPSLLAVGCEVRVFRPLSGSDKLARSHRKLVVVDGAAAITGGFGIRDTWLGDGIHAGSWRDTNVLFEGPAVSGAQQAFAENWQEAGGGLLPLAAFPALRVSDSQQGAVGAFPAVRAAFVASSQGVVTRAERLTQLMISAATRRLWIANAYFVPSQAILELIGQKARAGVDVRILAPDKNSDSKTAFGAQHLEFGELLEQGVKVWEYTSSMMHAKTMLVDDELALVGSINLDPLSLNELEENALVIQDKSFAEELGQAFSADCSRSKALSK